MNILTIKHLLVYHQVQAISANTADERQFHTQAASALADNNALAVAIYESMGAHRTRSLCRAISGIQQPVGSDYHIVTLSFN